MQIRVKSKLNRERYEKKQKEKIIFQNPKYIKDWNELKEEKSETHTLKIDVESGNGWIHKKEGKDDNSGYGHYLSTHTFYGSQHEYSTKLLQSCGFNVILANWDEIGY
jgi:hypothetical protein